MIIAGSVARRRQAPAWSGGLFLALAALASCGSGESEDVAEGRASRFGALRDLVWFDGGGSHDGGFFLDLFESTQADWLAYRRATGAPDAATDAFLARWLTDVGSPVDPAMPIVGLDLAEARAFAQWRLCRLPRFEEWRYAATAGGSFDLPWGNLRRAAYANTAELGHRKLTPVGMFESARAGDGPYDLIGNASEWTETCVLDDRDRSRGDVLDWRLDWTRDHAALRYAWVRGVPLPTFPALGVAGDDIARRVTGSAAQPMTSGRRVARVLSMVPNERGSLLGLRLAADPLGLLRTACRVTESVSAVDEAALREFLARHRAVLLPAWARVTPAERAAGAVGAWIEEELGP